MVDVSVTAANVLESSNAKGDWAKLGATGTQGQVVYKDTADGNKLKLADNNASAATADAAGILTTAGAAGQWARYVWEDDDFTPGFTMTMGEVYHLSGTAGGICPKADVTGAGVYPVILLVPKSTTKARLKIIKAGAALAS